MTRRYTRLTLDEWSCLLNLYSTGVNTIPELAERYAVSASSITSKARAAGITRTASFKPDAGIAAAASAAARLTFDPVPPAGARKPSTAETEQRVIATNEAALHGAMTIQRMLDVSLAAMTIPATPAEVAATVRMLDQAAAIAERVNKIRRTVLRLDRENGNSDAILPELPIRTMQDAEIKALRAEQAAFDGLSVADQRECLDQLDRDAQDADDVSAEPAEDHVEGFEQDAA